MLHAGREKDARLCTGWNRGRGTGEATGILCRTSGLKLLISNKCPESPKEDRPQPAHDHPRAAPRGAASPSSVSPQRCEPGLAERPVCTGGVCRGSRLYGHACHGSLPGGRSPAPPSCERPHKAPDAPPRPQVSVRRGGLGWEGAAPRPPAPEPRRPCGTESMSWETPQIQSPPPNQTKAADGRNENDLHLEAENKRRTRRSTR